MLEPMKVQTTGEFAELCIKIPLSRLEKVRAALESVLALMDDEAEGRGGEPFSTFEELFPDFQPGKALRVGYKVFL